MPYGRLNYTAFAELYSNGTNTTGQISVVLDVDVSDADTDEARTYDLTALPASALVNVTLANNSGASFILASLGFTVVNPDDTEIDHVVAAACGVPCFDSNPDFNDAAGPDVIPAPNVTGGFNCGAPPPGDNGTSPQNESFLSCNTGAGDGPTIVSANNANNLVLGRVTYAFTTPVNGDIVPLSLKVVSIYDDTFTEQGSCNPVIGVTGQCGTAQIDFITPTATPEGPTNTPTNTPTATNTPGPTNTPTATNTPVPPPSGSAVIKVPEPCTVDANGSIVSNSPNCVPNGGFPLVNLWICVVVNSCNGPGEGNLVVFEYALNVQSDYDNDDIPDINDLDIQPLGIGLTELGLGAYEFQVEYDNFVIQSVNPCDAVFSATYTLYPNGADAVVDGEGMARGPVDQVNSSNDATPPNGCENDPNAIGDGQCTQSLILENLIRFGCVTVGGSPYGPSGNMDLARLNLIPHPDLTNDIFPGNNNGVITVLKDNGCELADIFGHPTAGDVNGGLTPICRDIAITVRILEGDLNLDCDVDVDDAQLIATHYGAFFGSLLYSKWLDLEPNLHDLDIDIKDIQKVFGRQGSTCQVPIPDQDPLPPFTPFGD
jgi:hypothetical protein